MDWTWFWAGAGVGAAIGIVFVILSSIIAKHIISMQKRIYKIEKYLGKEE